MDGLRWLLLIVGALIVIGVYLYSRKERVKSSESKTAVEIKRREPDLAVDRQEPSFSDDVADDVDEPEKAESLPQKIVALRLVAANKTPFPGDELVLSLRGIGMRHGRFGIFHRYEGSDENKVIFSAASLVEPGSFDLENIRAQKIPGISLFMVLPGPIEGAQAFDLMMVAARALAQSMKAELLDESGSTLSIQRERYIREEIIQHQHGIKVS